MTAARHPTKTSKTGLLRIVQREGVRLTAYQDSIGVWTIGVGHTRDVRRGQRITLAQAYRYLRADVAEVEAAVRRLNVPSQAMFDALVSFGFNLGAGIFNQTHTIGKHLHRRHWDKAAESILLYDMAGGRHLPGLTTRRKAEYTQYMRGLNAYKRRLRRQKK